MGVTAAYYGGWLDRIIMRLMDVLFAFPIILLAIGVIAVLGPGHWTTAIAIGVVYTPIFARLLRGPSLVIATSDYVMGARCAGAGDARILLWHILPNLSSLILVQTSLLLSTAILVEASLSFLGLGIQPPDPSWGNLIAEGRTSLLSAWWVSTFPGLALIATVLALSLVSDGLRDVLDPRLDRSAAGRAAITSEPLP